ncbi:MAG: V-type ATPase subunit [Spirochaetaceae bacterium]|nr:MAG: V-type ATPase subunit [Spirochaetaceae bacterium]
MARPLKTYAFINAKLRTRISKILPEQFIRQLVRARSLAESVQMLAESDFAPVQKVYERTGDIKTAELELLRGELSIYLELERLLEEEVRDFVRALGERFEIENLKNALRLWFDRRIRGRAVDDARGYLLRRAIHHSIDLDGIIDADTLEQVADRLEGTPYSEIVRQQAAKVMQAASLFPLELTLDRYLYSRLVQATDQLSTRDREIAQRLLGVEIDLQNVGWLIRFKNFYSLEEDQALGYTLPGGLNLTPELMRESYTAERTDREISALVGRRYPEIAPLLSSQEQTKLTARLTMIERILEQILAIEVRKILTGYPFTIGIVLAYFILKANEIRKIMTVLNAKFYDWPEEHILALI